MKKLILLIIITILIKNTFYVTWGYVLDNCGNGIVLNPITQQPIDDYYNYICYDKNKMGNYAITITINKFNQIDDIIYRFDYYFKNQPT